MRIGFIGLGAMGRPMALRALRAGHELAVWARRPETTAPLAEAGAAVCATPAELAAASEIVVTIVTTSRDVENLAFGADGLVHGFARDGVHLDMSTIAPGAARDFAARYAEHSVHWIDAPVSGGEQAAQDGSLAIMAGGNETVFDSVRPLLECFGRTIVRIGEAGAGQVAKACNQMIMVSAIQACAEAMHLARAHGLDAEVVRKALLGGSAASRVLDVMGERMATSHYANGIQARLHHKDFGILMDEACRIGAPLPIASQVWQQLNALMHADWGREDTAILLEVLTAAGSGARSTAG